MKCSIVSASTVVSADSRPLRGRQSGHFLETTSLHPPQAALRRFPRNDTVQGSVDFIGLLKILSYAKPVIPRPVRRLVVGIRSLFAGFLFRSDGCFSFVGNVPPAAYFLSTATKSMQKTPPKTNGFWISFCVQELHPNSRRNRELTYFYSRCRCIGSLKGIAVLSWQSVLPSDRRNISFTRAGAAAGLLLSQFS